METKATHLAVPEDLAQSIAAYLMSKPYAEVAQMLDALRRCPGVSMEQKEPEGAPPD